MASPEVRAKLDHIPPKPGVYIMRDKASRIIYVGKAVSLKNRVRSYFTGSQQSPKVKVLVENVADLEYIVTDSEVEALILECNLIKEHRPRYNVNLKDDKTYPYLKVTLQEDYPRLVVTRNQVQDGSRYYGPYTSAGALHDTVRLLKKIFRLRNCKERELVNRQRPCLNYHIKRCHAPCMGNINPQEYREIIKEVCLFLDGRQEDLIQRLQLKMAQAAESLEYEEAARLRDQLQAVERVVERQKIISPGGADQDIIAFVRRETDACFQVFFVRGGKLMGRDHFYLEGTEELSRPEIMATFLKRYYAQTPFIPREILLGEEAAEGDILAKWLSQRRGRRVYLQVPQRGEKVRLVQMAVQNAMLVLTEGEARRGEGELLQVALEELATVLALPLPPERIECYDISNIQGTLAVGSMAVFQGGRPAKEEYRRFRIKTVLGANDFAMLREVLYRRFKRALDTPQVETESGGFASVPDLIIIDGGKGQLKAVVEVLESLGVEIPVFGLAKAEEELFAPGVKEAIRLPRDSQALYLLQRIRDEAHRFAVEYHRKLRAKQLSRSILDDVPGIGPQRKKALLQHFGSVSRLAKASEDELAALPGMNRRLAEEVLTFLRNQGVE